MTSFKHPLGVVARDKITGYEGLIVGRVEWFYGCLRYNLQAQTLREGKPVEEITIDEDQTEILKETEQISQGLPFEIESRALVRDQVTGYEGLVVARCQWLYAGNRYIVQAEELHEGKPVPTISCHAKQLEVVVGAGETVGATKGGPTPSIARESVSR